MMVNVPLGIGRSSGTNNTLQGYVVGSSVESKQPTLLAVACARCAWHALDPVCGSQQQHALFPASTRTLRSDLVAHQHTARNGELSCSHLLAAFNSMLNLVTIIYTLN